MKALILVCFVALAGCSTVASRREDPATFETTTTVSLEDFQGCFAEKTANLDVQYLPRRHGGTFSYGVKAGLAPRYVSWVVDVDDLGATRRITVHAISSIWGPDKKTAELVKACL